MADMSTEDPRHGKLVILLYPGNPAKSGCCYARKLGHDMITCVTWNDGTNSPMAADLEWDTRKKVLLWPRKHQARL